MSEGATVTDEQVKSVVHDELSPIKVTVGGVRFTVKPFKRRWQALFRRAALPMYRAELSATEEIQKAFDNKSIDYKNLSEILINSELEFDKELDFVAAIIIASQVDGAEKKLDEVINEKREWLLDNSTTQELRELIDAQAKVERLVEDVGERLPVRLTRSAHLAGESGVTVDMVKQLLTSSLQRSREPQSGGGDSTSPKPGGSSSDTLSETK